MKEQLTIISDDLNHGIITEKEAQTKLLILFGVSVSFSNNIDELANSFIQDYFYPDIQAKGECEESDDMKSFVKNWITDKSNEAYIRFEPQGKYDYDVFYTLDGEMMTGHTKGDNQKHAKENFFVVYEQRAKIQHFQRYSNY